MKLDQRAFGETRVVPDPEFIGPLWPASHVGCKASPALALLSMGADRLSVTAQAELVFTDPACLRDPRCLWHGMMILLRTGALESVDAHLWRLEHDRHGGFPDHVALMRAEHAKHAGDLVGSLDTLARLADTASPACLSDLAAPLYVEALVAVNEVKLGDRVLREHDFDRLLRQWEPIRSLVLVVRGGLHLIAGRVDKAFEDLLESSRVPAREAVASSPIARRDGLLALAAAAAGQSDVAAAAATQAYEAAMAWRSYADVAWGLYVLETVEDSERPSDRLRDAIDLMELARSPVGIATLCHEQGKRFLASGQLREGKAQLRRAKEAALRIGDATLTEKIDKLLREHTTRPTSRPSLTAQELRIAELAKDGYSNKQIANRLVLTMRTVEFHLSNVYRKLGVSGRRALAGETLPPRRA
ncbi:helix-turn-helix transcriptional regulator [Amycolatopsis keratiniphila]|uniref:helix-turn-helix transcriptional regulator n=1 Tax=Amycolatopsis keratiniphila TaxID=129921 RepID=UPI0033DF6556